MTREQKFRTSFIPQLVSYSGWENITQMQLQKIATADIPSFSIALGKTKYTLFDPMGKAISGEQDFLITVYYSLALRSTDDAWLEHSDISNYVEQFINNPIYIPPPVLSGETYRIERAKIIEVKAPALQSGDTRFTATLAAKYIFTLF